MIKTLIIGNGFDLDLGLETSYSNFINSTSFSKLEKDENNLARYLRSVHQHQNWVDVEHELKNYVSLIESPLDSFARGIQSWHSEDITIPSALDVLDKNSTDKLTKLQNDFKSTLYKEFVALKSTLAEYLTHLKWPDIQLSEARGLTLLEDNELYANNENHTTRRTKNPHVRFNQIFTLNYTNIGKILKTRLGTEHDIEVFHMHGSLQDKNIVFGVEDRSVPEAYHYLLKADHAAFGNASDLKSILNTNKELDIRFFGCSLGDTDDEHFKHFFQELVKDSQRQNPKITFYVYGRKGYINLRNRIFALTDGQFSRFKLNNDVTFFDIENNHIIDQNYLNSLP